MRYLIPFTRQRKALTIPKVESYRRLEKIIAECIEESKNSSLRVGQAFYNKYDKTRTAFPELFYETTNKRAVELIYQNYLSEEL